MEVYWVLWQCVVAFGFLCTYIYWSFLYVTVCLSLDCVWRQESSINVAHLFSDKHSLLYKTIRDDFLTEFKVEHSYFITFDYIFCVFFVFNFLSLTVIHLKQWTCTSAVLRLKFTYLLGRYSHFEYLKILTAWKWYRVCDLGR